MVTFKKAIGFSLIELIVTIAVLGVLIALGSSLSSGWTESANQQQAKAIIDEGISRAKSIALRNPDGVSETAPAIGLCLNSTLLSIVRQNGSNLNCTSTSSTLVWSAVLPENVIVKEASNTNVFLCLGMNSRGLLLPDDRGNQVCSLSNTLTSTNLYVCPCAVNNHSQHSSLCPLNDKCLEAKLY